MEILELIKRCIRIFYISRKPTGEEFNKVAKVAAAGVVLIGVLGVLISVLFTFINKV
ncbi:protein translocase SEC61 complex subunit gamma [Candidatus Micrarchaeota archaeon]|nr:protein translocase SEC61 complex subunit gamma [Candidatus Micrarchaeota archaeon]